MAEIAEADAVGRELLWEGLSEIAERVTIDPEVRWELIKHSRARLAGYACHVADLFRQVHSRELAVGSALISRHRSALVVRVLGGEFVHSLELGYELEQEHIAVVADGRVAEALPSLARRARRHLLQVARPQGVAWAWFGGRGPLRTGELDELVAWLRAHDGRAAFGEAAGGVTGFRVSHQTALEAWTVGHCALEPVTRFADVALLAALLRDAGLARLFIERELGALASPGVRETTVRDTLRVYLEHRQSISATAALLGYDRKTIRRHLAGAEDLLPRTLAERSAEVGIALRLLDVVDAST